MIVGTEVGVRVVRALRVAGERPGKGSVQGGIALVDHLGDDVAVDGHRERLADAHVLEGRLVDRHAHAVVAPAERWHAIELQVWRGLHQGEELVQRGHAHHVELLAAEERGLRGGVLGEVKAHRVHVRKLPAVPVFQVIVGVLHEQRAVAGRELLEHEGAGADGILGETAGRFHGLARHDHRRQ